jgi:hypothetical protein
MPDFTLGPMRPSDPAATLAKAAEKLGIPVPPVNEAQVEHVARAIRDEFNKWSESPYEQMSESDATDCARAAIAAMDKS